MGDDQAGASDRARRRISTYCRRLATPRSIPKTGHSARFASACLRAPAQSSNGSGEICRGCWRREMKPPLRQSRFDKAGNEVVQVSLYVAATSPLTLVTFDKGDEPSFTLDQINGRTYDRLKLCRTTTGLDPTLSAMDGMAVIVSYTGALLFPRMPGVREGEVLASANRLLLKLTFGGIDFDALAPNDLGFGLMYGTGYFLAAGGAWGRTSTHSWRCNIKMRAAPTQ